MEHPLLEGMPPAWGPLEQVWPFYAAVLGGYLLGAIPFGLLITWLAGLGDVRRIGSGNIGATNVLRTGRKDLAALTLLLDGGKGAAAVLIVTAYLGTGAGMIAGGAALLGHCFPIWLRFKGGKGVATAFGAALALDWKVGLAMIVIWLVVAGVTRFSSLAGVLSAVAAPALFKWMATEQMGQFAIGIAMLIILRHIANLRRLMKGQEPRIGESKNDDGTRAGTDG
jgi:acyl phosphate:glycerol-3-phosphate acyltransferase